MLRVLHSLLALALILSPMAMQGGSMAMAHAPAASGEAQGHCPDGQMPAGQEDHSKAMADCTGMCSALAGVEPGGTQPQMLLSTAAQPRGIAVLDGLKPESELPPPRFS